MSRIILGMAGASFAFATMTAVLGCLSHPDQDPQALFFRYHFLCGVFSVLFTILIHCLVFTYFLGTTRWVQEAAAAYSLGPEPRLESQSLRRQAFRYIVASIFVVLGVIVSGAGSRRSWDPSIHLAITLAAHAFLLRAYWVEYSCIERHMALTDRVMQAVEHTRRSQSSIWRAVIPT